MAKDHKRPRHTRSRAAVNVSSVISEPAPVDSVSAEIAISAEPQPDPAAGLASEPASLVPATVVAKPTVEPIAEAVATAYAAAATAKQPSAEPALSELTQVAPSTPPEVLQKLAEPQAFSVIAPQSEAKAEFVASLPEVATKPASSPVSTYEATVMGMAEINAKAVGALHANSVATLAFFETLMGARSLSEAIRLQTEHARKQFETMTGQTKELTALARRVVQDAASGRKR